MDQDKTRRPEKAGTAIKLLYISLGIGALQVNHGKTKSFDHLPFDVTFMSYDL